MNIEPLESRIAPAGVFTYTDVDGDLVTVKTSKGTNAGLAAAIQPNLSAIGLGFRLQGINLRGNPTVFDGTDLSITAKPQDVTPGDADKTKSGDGSVFVGHLDATGIDLGKVAIGGDLAYVEVGTNTPGKLTVKSLTAGNLGDTIGISRFRGSAGPLTLAGNIQGSVVIENGGDLASLTVGGSLLGAVFTSTDMNGDIGPVVIKGDIRGSASDFTGSIRADGKLGNVSIAGSVIGGTGLKSGRIEAGDTMGSVTIKGSLLGGRAVRAGSIFAGNAIGNVTIGGSMIGVDFDYSGSISVDDTEGTIGLVKIGRDLSAGSMFTSALIQADGKIAGVSVGGSITKANISSLGTVDAVTIGGAFDGARLYGKFGIGAVKIGHDMIGGAIETNGGDIGAIVIGGDVIGGPGSNTGSINGRNIASIAIAGSLVGGGGGSSGALYFNDCKSVTIGGDIRGGTASFSGQIEAFGNIGSLKIGGDLRGTNFSDTGTVQTEGKITSLTVGGSIVGGHAPTGGTTVTDTGNILAEQLGSVTVGGSVIAGSKASNSTLTRSGSIVAEFEIGSINILGGLLGNATNAASIYAHGLEGDPVANNIAIKTIKIAGNVERAFIFGGVDTAGAAANGTGDAQIGSISVGGDVIATSMGSGVTSGNGVIGDGSDTLIGIGAGSKIGSIIIKGQVLGAPGNSPETFGFFAHAIGSFKYNGITVPLKAGAGNDTFFLGQARALGSSLSPATVTKPDAFAVHVYEV